MSMSQQDLFDRLVTLESKKLALAEDISQLKADAKYDAEMNPAGIAKEDIKTISAAAKLKAKKEAEPVPDYAAFDEGNPFMDPYFGALFIGSTARKADYLQRSVYGQVSSVLTSQEVLCALGVNINTESATT